MNRLKRIGLLSASLLLGCVSPHANAQQPFYCGADISALPNLEKAGAHFGDPAHPGDLPTMMAERGCNLFRLRLFVDPNSDYAATGGANQDLAFTLALAHRVKATGASLLLDFHYADSWADPAHQNKPKAWADLHDEALEKQVHDYTADTLAAFRKEGVLPELVQIGNEIAPGMIWPDGKITGDKDKSAASWDRLAGLINAGIRAVREVQEPAKPMKVMIHIHGGGREGLPAHFFNNLTPRVKDFDIIGLSFYPGNRETISILQNNLKKLADQYDKNILIAETSYPNSQTDIEVPKDLQWPTTPEGQKLFLLALKSAVAETPNHRGIGFVYWYPEAIRTPGLQIWHDGAMALFDSLGQPLPAMDAFRP